VWAILALGVDARRRYLWATTAAMPENLHFKTDDRGRSALLRFSLDGGALLKRYDLPRDTEHALGDLTVSLPAMYSFPMVTAPSIGWPMTTTVCRCLAPAGTFPLAANAGGSVPMGARCLCRTTRAGSVPSTCPASRAALVPHPRELSLAGIDGVYLAGRTMNRGAKRDFAGEDYSHAPRSAHTRIEGFEVLESNSPSLGAPTHGVVVGNRFYFIANSGWDRLTDDGQLKAGATFDSPPFASCLSTEEIDYSHPWRLILPRQRAQAIS